MFLHLIDGIISSFLKFSHTFSYSLKFSDAFFNIWHSFLPHALMKLFQLDNILNFTFSASCFWENIDLVQNNLGTYAQVYTAYDCQAICATQSDCYYFVFDNISFYCIIKGSQLKTGYNTRFTSGPKTCNDGKMIN